MLKNISWLVIGNTLVKPLWLGFIAVACIRVLDESGYGVLTASLFLVAITRSVADVGLTPYTVREVARVRDQASRYFTNLLAAKAVLAVASVGAALAVGILLGYSGTKFLALCWAGAFSCAMALTDYCRAYYQAFEEMQYEAISVILEKICVIAGGLPALLYYGTAHHVLAGMALGMFGAFILNFVCTTSRFASLDFALLDLRFIGTNISHAFVLGLASQFVAVYFYTDGVMVDAMAGEAAAGQYGAAYRLLQATLLIHTIVATVVFPRFSSLYHSRRADDFKTILTRSTFGLLGLSIGIALLVTPSAPYIMELLKGDASFTPAADALRILIWALPFMSINRMLSVTMNATDDQNVLASILGIAAVFNVGLNFILIPSLSFLGAAIATLATEGLIALMLGARFAMHTQYELTDRTAAT